MVEYQKTLLRFAVRERAVPSNLSLAERIRLHADWVARHVGVNLSLRPTVPMPLKAVPEAESSTRDEA